MYEIAGTKIKEQWVIEDGELRGTVLEPIMAFVGVLYPHRKTKDLYIPPIKDKNEKWHCCQECSSPDFETEKLMEHLKLHAGRLLKIKE